MTKLDNLHEKNSYYVSVTHIENGIIIYYPANLLVNPIIPAETHKYVEGDGKIIYDDNFIFECPNYTRKLIRITDMYIKMSKRHMSLELCRKDSELTCDSKFTDEESRKYNILFKKIADIIYRKYNISDAKRDGVEDGFRSIFKLFVMGGL